jgi:membrane-bound ClpP family serine protease
VGGRRDLWRYLLWQLPGWGVAGLVLLWLEALTGLPVWAVVALWGVFITKDLLLYPVMRTTFRPPRDDLVGARGRAVEALAPSGYVRVNGELWRARIPSSAAQIRSGAAVVVTEARGLTLIVEEDTGSAPSPP